MPGDDEGALALEEEVIHAHGAQFALAAHEGGAEVSDGARGVIGGSLHDDGGAVGAFAVVDDLFVGRLVLLGGALDGAFHILLGHRLTLGGLHQQAQTQVGRGIGATGKDGQFNFLTNLGEGAGHVAPTFQFSCFAVFKCATHSIDVLYY